MEEFSTRAPGPPDGLFLERLDTFMDKCLADIKAFSEREYRPFEETRQYVAEWHAKYLFQPQPNDATGHNALKVRSVLCNASRMLESLCEVSGVQSFILAVDPNNPADMGFLGGSVVGREFWRGMRGGGELGAKSFKVHCLRDLEAQVTPPYSREEGTSSRASSVAAKIAPARSLKNDLYESVRKALRSVSGVRNAEMKWTNPERLDVYGVRLVGWPSGIPAQNPSSLKASQNKILLECLENGTMRFEKLFPAAGANEHADHYNLDEGHFPDEAEDADDFSWAYDADAGDSSISAIQAPSAVQTAKIHAYSYAPEARSRTGSGNALSSQMSGPPHSLPSSAQPPSSRKRPRSESDQAADQNT
ncbi:hypothetical protein LshimejAT787_0802530 [Lyophyllum shimeji]|uniref:Uncharacterized protein n=1 Tax=Lyophyllum shimeji TaxID=47721 RepID=A0A9P3PS54_LYOSH|nr:hypothetical protein LshimejAT787_0802530 [Lyophyllum shimeji]